MTYLIATRLFRYSKLSLLFGTLFTLKSAADRDRLGGTTFINLNYWCSFFFLSKTGKVSCLRVCVFRLFRGIFV